MSKEEQREKDLERIKALRLMDDDFMTICFNGYIEGAELLLRVILERDDLKVTEVRTQERMDNFTGRSVVLDIYATGTNGDKYDIEIQRADKGACVKRARYHSSLIDVNMLIKGDEFDCLRDNYVIFITENDVLGFGDPIYHVDRMLRERNVQFNDGEHIIYVNGSIRVKDTALGRLMSDFYSQDADEMYYRELADRVRYFKETKEGVRNMCDILDEMKKEAAYDATCEFALKLIKDGSLSIDKIAEYSGLSIEKVRELAGNKSA